MTTAPVTDSIAAKVQAVPGGVLTPYSELAVGQKYSNTIGGVGHRSPAGTPSETIVIAHPLPAPTVPVPTDLLRALLTDWPGSRRDELIEACDKAEAGQ